MSGSLMLLITCVVVFAAWLVTHVALVAACVRTAELSRLDRWMSPIPPYTALAGWRAGRKRTVYGWACLIALYGVLRVLLALVDTQGPSP